MCDKFWGCRGRLDMTCHVHGQSFWSKFFLPKYFFESTLDSAVCVLKFVPHLHAFVSYVYGLLLYLSSLLWWTGGKGKLLLWIFAKLLHLPRLWPHLGVPCAGGQVSCPGITLKDIWRSIQVGLAIATATDLSTSSQHVKTPLLYRTIGHYHKILLQ